MKKLFKFSSALLLLVSAGCGKNNDAAVSRVSAGHPLPAPPAIAMCEPGHCGGELHLALVGNPASFNPVTATDAASLEMTRLMFSALVAMDWQAQQARPALAESWSVAADSKTWTFKLRRGLRWSDGQPLTADDVVFTWNDVIYNPRVTNLLADTFRLGGKNFAVTKVDDVTVQVVTPDVFAPFVEFFGTVVVLPRHALQRAVAENQFASAFNSATSPDDVVVSGPFRLKKFNRNSSVILERNPEFWTVDKAGQRLPYFDFVIFYLAPDVASAANLFLTGGSDAFDRVKPDDFGAFEKASVPGKFQLVNAGVGLEKDIFWFNENTNVNARTGRPLVSPAKLKWFRDERFRRGVALAIDRARIAREVYSGRAEPGYGFVSSENKRWSNPGIARQEFDTAKARALLAEAGLADRDGDGVLEDADGNKTEFEFNTNVGNNQRVAAAQMIVEDLRKVGIKLNFKPLPFAQILGRAGDTCDYECMLLGLGGGGLDPESSINALKSGDPLCQWFPHQTAPSTDWEARIDFLMDAQMHTLDFAERKKYFDEVQTILAEKQPMSYTVSPFAYAAVRAGIGNVRASASAGCRATWNAEELYRK